MPGGEEGVSKIRSEENQCYLCYCANCTSASPYKLFYSRFKCTILFKIISLLFLFFFFFLSFLSFLSFIPCFLSSFLSFILSFLCLFLSLHSFFLSSFHSFFHSFFLSLFLSFHLFFLFFHITINKNVLSVSLNKTKTKGSSLLSPLKRRLYKYFSVINTERKIE